MASFSWFLDKLSTFKIFNLVISFGTSPTSWFLLKSTNEFYQIICSYQVTESLASSSSLLMEEWSQYPVVGKYKFSEIIRVNLCWQLTSEIVVIKFKNIQCRRMSNSDKPWESNFLKTGLNKSLDAYRNKIKCMGRDELNIHDQVSKHLSRIIEVLSIIKGIRDDNSLLLGLSPEYARPDWMILQALPIHRHLFGFL
ncbi:hypothetical protein FXO38_35339 [Capsicum annuum]|nr:hypothetical protein FXO38_35339 [Capsicum annuum]KAF3685126.1 hypothetical protein FXO37_00933 [Capsicum annuum]